MNPDDARRLLTRVNDLWHGVEEVQPPEFPTLRAANSPENLSEVSARGDFLGTDYTDPGGGGAFRERYR
jgi:hypothetical protein